MSASPEAEAKPNVPVDHDAEEQSGGEAEDVKAATPIAGDDDQDEEEDQSKPNHDDDDEDDEDGGDGSDAGSDDESILSEVDEAQFEDFDPEKVDVDDRPQLAIDEENLKLVGRHKRKRAEDGDGERASRRKKEGRREKKNRRMKELEEGPEADDAEGTKSRRKEKKKKEATPENEELLDPETRTFLLRF